MLFRNWAFNQMKDCRVWGLSKLNALTPCKPKPDAHKSHGQATVQLPDTSALGCVHPGPVSSRHKALETCNMCCGRFELGYCTLTWHEALMFQTFRLQVSGIGSRCMESVQWVGSWGPGFGAFGFGKALDLRSWD